MDIYTVNIVSPSWILLLRPKSAIFIPKRRDKTASPPLSYCMCSLPQNRNLPVGLKPLSSYVLSKSTSVLMESYGIFSSWRHSYLIVVLLNTRNNLLYSTKFNVNQWLWSFLIYLSIIAFQILLGYKQKIWGGICCFKWMVAARIWCFAPNCTASICEYRTPHNTPRCNSDSLRTTLVHEFADCDPKQYVQSRHSGQGWDNNAFL